jgi:hypothetical protein
MKIMTTVTWDEDTAPQALRRFSKYSPVVIILLSQQHLWTNSEPIFKKVAFSTFAFLCAIALIAGIFYQKKFITKHKKEIVLLDIQDDELVYPYARANAFRPDRGFVYRRICVSKIQKIELLNDLIVFEGERYFSHAVSFRKKQIDEIEGFARTVIEKNPHITFVRHR